MDDQTNHDSTAALEQLKNYIKQQMQSGLHPNEIHTQLQQAGWQDHVIKQAFQHVQADVVPNFEQSHDNSATHQPPVAPTTDVPADDHTVGQNVQQPLAASVTRGRFKTGWLLFKQSIRVLKNNKGLTRFVVTSFLVSFILTIIFIFILIGGRNIFFQSAITNSGNKSSLKPAGLLVGFLYYVLAFFIVNLYSAGLVANVIDLFHGKSQGYSHYMKVAWSKAVTLLVFSVIEATVGLVLRAIAERSKLLGRIVSWILGALWSLARLFVVPVIVTSNDNAFTSIKRSTKLLVSTWGENIGGRVSFGGVAFVLFLLVLIPTSVLLIFIGVAIGHGIGQVLGFLLVLLLYVAFFILISTASSVLNTALFYYAQYKQIPAAFDAELINSVFIRRKRTGILGLGNKTT